MRRGGGRGVEGDRQLIILNAYFQFVEYRPSDSFSFSGVACEMRLGEASV